MTSKHQPEPSRRLSAVAAARLARGFSLIEVLVASAVFLLIMLAVYQVYIRSLEGHKAGVGQAEMTQSVRFGFEEMATRIRSSGYEFDLDGPPPNAPNQSDESIEYMGETAIIVRANYDFAYEPFRGRESLYESGGDGDCCPIVTTGNDEILAFALGKDEGASDQPTETLVAYFDLDAPRDGKIALDTGEISGEGAVTIPNVALTDFSNPPYVLYQFTWADPVGGNAPVLQRRPLVDNILSLQFEYFDEGGDDLSLDASGNSIGLPLGLPNPSADAASDSTGRSRRENVRKVRIRIKGMTPEPDLRYNDPADSNPLTTKHRKFELVEDVHTFNVGRRGLKDKDDKPPERVNDVQLCSGQCGMVRVDWKPGPPEDQVADHVVILAECVSGSSPDYNSPLASFVVVSDLDLSVSPEREYAIFDLEDDPDLIAGTEVCARVIPRDDSGGEAEEPADSDKNSSAPDPSTNDYTVITDYSRAEAPSRGTGSGFDETDSDWPDAKADNDPSGVEITADDTLASFPLANRIQLSWQTPIYQLNRLSQGGGSLYDWTTDPGAGYAAAYYDTDANVPCYRSESTPNDATADFRTPTEELSELGRDSKPNVYIFRVSGSNPDNWGPGQADCDLGTPGPNCIDDPRNFMPYAGNLYALESASLASASFSFTDRSDSSFYSPSGSTDPYEDRFLSSVKNDVAPDGFEPPISTLTPGEVYYYRVRVVDYCWNDDNRDGVEDTTAGSAQELTAWSTQEDFPTEADWRMKAISLSPFYPPFLHQGNPAAPSDLPSTMDDDSDLVDLAELSDIDTYALPAYALPSLANGANYVRPEKPTEFYLSRANDSASSLLPTVGGEKGVRVLFNAAKRSAPQDTSGAGSISQQDVGYTWYHLRRKAVPGYTAGTPLSYGTDLNWEYNAGEPVTTFRLSDEGLRDFTINRRAETLDGMNSALSNDALYLSSSYYVYKLFTAQVVNQSHYDPAPAGTAGNSLPLHVSNDGSTNNDARYSIGSRAFLFPAPFYDAVAEIEVDSVPSNGLNTTRVDVEVTMDSTADPAGTCEDMKGARLLAYDYDTDEFMGSSDWIAIPHSSPAVPADCSFDFGSALVNQALRAAPDRARFRVEISDVDETLTDGGDWDKQPRGARVRSDLVGEAGDYELSTTCTGGCGDNTVAMPANNANRILGQVTEDEIQTYDSDRVMGIELAVDVCNTQDFSLLQIDVAIETGGAPMPRFLSARLSGLRSGSLTLPPPEFSGVDGSLYRLRWFEGSFCDASGVCEFPVVDADSPTIELRVRFDAPVCAGPILDSFNYRVLVSNAGTLEELLCSNRGEFDPDNIGGADEPAHYCTVGGIDPTVDCGRGPALTTEPCGQNPNCDHDCPAGVCPVNSDFSLPPSIELDAGNTVVRFSQQEDCSDGCALDLTQVRATFVCNGVDRVCSADNLPNFVSAALIWDDMTTFPLTGGTVDAVPSDHVTLEWTGLSDLEVLAGLPFSIEFTFDGTMIDTQVTDWHLQFGAPLDALANCDTASAADPLDIPSN